MIPRLAGPLALAAAVIVAIVAVEAFRRARRASTAGWYLAAAAAVALALTPALSGHAAASRGLGPLPVMADALHVLGAGGWLDSLLAVLAAGVPAALRLPESDRGTAIATLVNAFSPIALFLAGLTVATGLVASWGFTVEHRRAVAKRLRPHSCC